MKAFINWLHALLFPSFVNEAVAVRLQLNGTEEALTFTRDRLRKEIEARIDKEQNIINRKPHPIIAFLNEPKAWKTEVPLSDVEIEQVKVFFKSAACAKFDIMIHNIALQDMQRAWQPAVASREYELGAAQGRLSAWLSIKQLPETLRPQSEHTEAGEGNTPNLDHLVP